MVTYSQLKDARITMLSVATQQEIVDDLMAAYTTLEAELRRVNQWDLEREFELVESWLRKACIPSDKWSLADFENVNEQKKVNQIVRKLNSFSNEYNHLIDREKLGIKKYSAEKRRLVEILSKAEIGKGYDNISARLASEENPGRVIAVLKDIRFGKNDRNRFLPSQVEFVFALSAVFTEIRINMLHNNKWSNYERLLEIFNSQPWQPDARVWDSEIALNNNKVERKIITGNILGAYVHPAISELRPRFISFSLKGEKPQTQIGLLRRLNAKEIYSAKLDYCRKVAVRLAIFAKD